MMYQDDYTPEFKATVALEVIAGSSPVQLIARDHDRIEVALAELWAQQLITHSDEFSTMVHDSHTDQALDYATGVFTRLAAVDDARFAEAEPKRLQEYSRHAAMLERHYRESELGLLYPRHWSTDAPLPTYKIITGVLMRPIKADLATICERFGVDAVIFVLWGLRRISEQKREILQAMLHDLNMESIQI